MIGGFNTIDLLILIPILLGLVRGFWHGIVHELTSILGLVLGIILSKLYAASFSSYLLSVLHSQEWACRALAYILIFVGAFMLVSLAGAVLQRILKAVYLNWLNRLFGGLFGALKWALIMSVVLNILVLAEPYYKVIQDDSKSQSRLYHPTLRVASTSWNKLIAND